MKLNKIDKTVLLIICLTLLVGLFTIYQRVEVEKQYKTAEIVLDYNEMEKFADSSEKDLSWWLKEFKDYGSQSVAIQEETINLLIADGKPLRAEIVSKLVENYNWIEYYKPEIVEMIMNKEIDQYDVVVSTKDKETYDYIVSGLNERYTDEFFNTYSFDDVFYIVLDGTANDVYYSPTLKIVNNDGKGVYEAKEIADSRLLNIGIGYDDEKINLIKDANLDVILRPINFPTHNEKLADVYKNANEKYNLKPHLYILHGKEVLGFPDNEQKLLDYVMENDISIVMIESSEQREHIEQEGLEDLVEDSRYQALRAFTMWDYIRARNKYYNYEGAEEIENTMFRAITERNIRVIYFKPFYEEEKSTKYMTEAEEYERTFTSLEERLSEHNITLGKASSIQEFHIGAKRLAVMAAGITLSCVFLFLKMFNIRHKLYNYLYLAAVPAAAVPFVMRNIAEKGFSFAAAVSFSGIAIYFFMMNIKKIFISKKQYTNVQLMIYSTLILTASVAISLAGAVFVDAMLADVKYFLEMDIFRGVKFAQILPFGVFLMMFLIYFMNNEQEDSVKSIVNTTIKLMNKEIKIYYGIIAGILAVVGYIYISRTGHETNIQPSNIEMISRNFMEYVLLARPRTKEFLIAFPAIFAAVYAASKKSIFYTGLFMLASAIGTSSVINTFSHLRTPVYLSFARTLIALGFGIIIGCILVVVLDWINKLFVKLQERLK
jgi:hypothetical protein